MKKEIENWLQQAREDLDAAKFNFKGKKYKYAAFLCQQAVEKALKAVLIEKTGRLDKLHDLVFLGKKAEIPGSLLGYCREITPAYIYTRYPDMVMAGDMDKKAKNFIQYTEEIFQWAENQLQNS